MWFRYFVGRYVLGWRIDDKPRVGLRHRHVRWWEKGLMTQSSIHSRGGDNAFVFTVRAWKQSSPAVFCFSARNTRFSHRYFNLTTRTHIILYTCNVHNSTSNGDKRHAKPETNLKYNKSHWQRLLLHYCLYNRKFKARSCKK